MLKLENGTTYFTDDNGKKVCTGSQMGRPNIIPGCVIKMNSVKLRLEKLTLFDSDYDKAGAYWGYTAGTDIYCAWGTPLNKISGNPFPSVQIFVRAKSRTDAKSLVRAKLSNAKFFR